MSKYTVLLLYPDYLNDQGDETYMAHVEADTSALAVEQAKREAALANSHDESDIDIGEDADDFVPLIVFPDHLECCIIDGPDPVPDSEAMRATLEEIARDLAELATHNVGIYDDEPTRDAVMNIIAKAIRHRDAPFKPLRQDLQRIARTANDRTVED